MSGTSGLRLAGDAVKIFSACCSSQQAWSGLPLKTDHLDGEGNTSSFLFQGRFSRFPRLAHKLFLQQSDKLLKTKANYFYIGCILLLTIGYKGFIVPIQDQPVQGDQIMRQQFIQADTRAEALKKAPWAAITVRFCGGYMAFESVADARTWKNQK